MLLFNERNAKIFKNQFKEAFILEENKKDEMQAIDSSDTKEPAMEPEVNEPDTAQADETAEAEDIAKADDAEEKSELDTELEQIRDMFQQELDNASSDSCGDVLIQQLDDIADADDSDSSDEDEDNAEVKLCECCGVNPCSKEHGEDYPYCDECRDIMKKYPMRASGIIMTIVMIAMFILTAVASASYAEDFLTVADASLNYDSGKIMTAMTSYYTYVESAADSSISMKAVRDLLDGYSKTGYITDASELIERIYGETALKMPWNKKYSKLLSDADSLTVTYQKVAEIITPVMSGDDYDYDEIIAELDALYETQPTEAEGIEEYESVFIEYYKYVVMSISKKGLDEQLAQLKKVDEANDKGLEWAYLSNYCAIAAKSGDEELTNKLFDRLIDINEEDTNAYVALASYYRYLDTPDPDKMLEICNKAKESVPSGDVSYMPTMAIAYLLKGEGSVALETMTDYMSQSSYTVQTCNLYALCAAYNGDDDTYNQMKTLLENSGYELSSLVAKYKKDKLTIEQVLTDKEGDI